MTDNNSLHPLLTNLTESCLSYLIPHSPQLEILQQSCELQDNKIQLYMQFHQVEIQNVNIHVHTKYEGIWVLRQSSFAGQDSVYKQHFDGDGL